MPLEEFLRHYSRNESIRLKVFMVKKGKCYRDTVCDIIERHTRNKKILKNFKDNCPEGIDEQFNVLVEKVRKMQADAEKKKSKTSPLKSKSKSGSNLKS